MAIPGIWITSMVLSSRRTKSLVYCQVIVDALHQNLYLYALFLCERHQLAWCRLAGELAYTKFRPILEAYVLGMEFFIPKYSSTFFTFRAENFLAMADFEEKVCEEAQKYPHPYDFLLRERWSGTQGRGT